MSDIASKTAIGIDIGGTFVKFGLVRGKNLLFQEKFSTEDFGTPAKLQQGLVEAVESVRRIAKTKIHGVGIGIPGLVRYPSGVVRTCVNIPGWKDVPLKSILQKKLKLPVAVENDVNVMALAEWGYGAGKGARNMFCMTLGTGVGGGLILDGTLYRGADGSAGEIGHMPLNETGPACPCGGVACLERYVGNSEIVDWVKARLRQGTPSILPKLAKERGTAITPELMDEAARRGDKLSKEIWAQVGTHVGITLAGVLNLLNPERVVVGGGIAKAGKPLFGPMREAAKRRAMRGVGTIPIVPAALGNSAGLIGAALLVLQGDR